MSKIKYKQTNTQKSKTKPEPTPVQPVKQTPLHNAWEWLSKRNFKWIFWISFGICALLVFYWSFKAGIEGDGPIEHEYGKQCLNYYLSWGKDTACIDFKWDNLSYPNEKYYGSGFETTFALLQHCFKWDDPLKARIYYLAVWCIALLLFLSLFAKELTDWKGALLALLLSFSMPYLLGQFSLNVKDVPHALGYVIALLFLLRFLKRLPKISISNLIGISLGIMIALSVRLGGLLLIGYIGLFLLLACFLHPNAKPLFKQKQYLQILKTAGALIIAVVAGFLVGLLFYPNFFEEGFKHLTSGMQVMTNFPQRIPFIFEGVQTDSLKKPWYYLCKMFYITTPLFILVLLHLAILIVLWKWKKIGAFNVLLLLFAFIFPFAYMTYNKAPVYDGWRHVLFAYITVPAIMTIGYREIIHFFKSSILKWGLTAVITIFITYFFVWNLKNGPYQLCYYNNLVGGTKGAFKKYDFNLVQIAAPEGVYWLLKSLDPNDFSPEKSLVIALNSSVINKSLYIPQKWRDKVQLKDLAYKSYSSTECDYAVLTTLFAPLRVLSSFYPPKGVIYDRKVDDVVIMCVVDRRNDTDYKGIKLVQENNFEEGMKLMEEAYNYNPKNYTLFFWLGYGYYRTGNFEKAIEFLNLYKKFYATDEQAHRILGYTYFAQKEYDNAITAFNIAFSQNRSDLAVAHMIAVCLYEKKDYKAGIKFLEPLVKEKPEFTEGKKLLDHLLHLQNN